MDKYQVALNNIIRSCCSYCNDNNGCQNCKIKQRCNATAKKWVDTLQELINEKKTNETNKKIMNKVKVMTKKEAFKIVNGFIKKYYPFAKGKKWDKKNGNIHFILGNHSLEEYIEILADDEFDIEKFEKEINNE